MPRKTLTYPSLIAAALTVALLQGLRPSLAAARPRLELSHVAIALPGSPATILAADVDRDGDQDLVVAVAYTEWDQLGFEESTEMDGIDGLVEVLTIVPSLIDRRELWIFLAQDGGGYLALDTPLVLDRSVVSLEAGPPELPVVALTDDGLSALRLDGEGTAARATLEPLVTERSLLQGTGTLLPGLGLGHDLDADGSTDIVFPTRDGATIFSSRGGRFDAAGAGRLRWPAPLASEDTPLLRRFPLPTVRDVDGDGLPDLLLPHPREKWRHFHVFLNAGGGRFLPEVAPLGAAEEEPRARPETDDETGQEESPHVVYFGDVDGDGRAEYVTQEDLAQDDAGMRQEMREAKRPPFRYRFHRMGHRLERVPEPYLELEALGYAFDGDDELGFPGGFQDLDGDGRQDLITLTLDFSLMQAVRILATHRISIGLDFHVWCQDGGGRFRPVSGLDLSGKFRLDLDNFKIGQLSQFAGDFDADGRADFVQMGRGRTVGIHRGREGCFYPPEPDLSIRLEDEPRDLQLVQVRDLDADGHSDLLVIQPQKVTEPGVTPPVRLDLYLSGGGA